MQRHRFYAPPAYIQQSHVTLNVDETHHLVRVLRLTPGTVVYVFDGEGSEYECEILRLNKDKAILSVISQLSNEVESPVKITLGQALIKNDKFDWVVQKATELGVTKIVPLVTRYSEIKKADGNEQRLQRWRRIALEATKQCGRRKLTLLDNFQNFDQFCQESMMSNETRLFFSERKGGKLSDFGSTQSIAVAIGPEGGWGEEERLLAESAGFVPIHLGTRILRSETAAISALTLTQHLFGDLK